MQTIRIELRFDDNKEHEEILLTAAKMAAKHLFTTAVLISGKRKPQIAVYSSDMFSPEEEILLADDIPTDSDTHGGNDE